jgi:ParB/RepB/Spo0J family partition protein
MKISISDIIVSPKPIRTTWDESKMAELSSSIMEQKGVIAPIKVRHLGDGKYEVVFGHRRLEAAKRAGFEYIDCIVDELDDTNTLVQALIENVMREDMTPMDTARALQRLISETGWSQREIARHGIMSQHKVSMLIALLDTPKEVQDLISSAPGSEVPEGKVTEGHVREVRQALGSEISDLNVSTNIIKKAAKEGLTIPQIKQVAEEVKRANIWGGQKAVDEVINKPLKTTPANYSYDEPKPKIKNESFHEPVTVFSWFKQQRITEMQNSFKLIGDGLNLLEKLPEDPGTAKIILKQTRGFMVDWIDQIDRIMESIDEALEEDQNND